MPQGQKKLKNARQERQKNKPYHKPVLKKGGLQCKFSLKKKINGLVNFFHFLK